MVYQSHQHGHTFGSKRAGELKRLYWVKAYYTTRDIEAVIRSAQAYVDLLDYEAIHGVEAGSYCGVEGKVTGIQDVLSTIERETSTQCRRGGSISS